MKIVLLTNILNPYRKAFYDELAKQCKNQGHSFHVLVMSAHEYNRQWHYDDYKTDYSILLKCKSFRIKHMPIYINMDLKKRLKDLQPNIVIMAGGYMLPSVWKACRYKKSMGYKTYFWSESHLGEVREYKSIILKMREFIRNAFYPKFDGFWYPGEKALEFIRCYAKKDAQCFAIPNLIDNNRFLQNRKVLSKEAVRIKYDLHPEKFILFAPMRLTWVKGLEPFMDIVTECPAKIKDRIQLVVAGEGELESLLRAKAQSLGVDLKLLGYQKENEIIELYQGADCFFMPSLSDPSPLTCVEALWMGLPLFVSEHVGNHPEVIEKGINGYVYSYNDAGEACRLLEKLVNSESEWFERAEKASLEIANDRFEVHKVTEALIKNSIR